MRTKSTLLVRVLHATLVAAGGAALTLGFFLVLPLIEAITQPASGDTLVRAAETADLPPPPEVPEQEEPEEEEKPEEKPPELSEEAQPLDLAQLELALNPGFGDGFGGAEFALKIAPSVGSGGPVEELFSADDLDQKPRVIYQPGPVLDANARKHTPGAVYVIFVVDPNGRVENPLVQKSSDPVLDRPALAAVKQWKFEPGKRKGQAVRFRMRVPIVFPEK
jgi:protein TonB